jgi:ornithine decarboxylase
MTDELDDLLKSYDTDSAEPQGASPFKVLIVDDEPMIRKSLADVLRDYTVVEAGNGAAALKLVDRQTICVIMDAKMPVMNGFEATVRIKELYPHLPVIMHTAYAGEHRTANIVDYGFSGYVEKGPEAVSALRDKVQRACQKYQRLIEYSAFTHEPGTISAMAPELRKALEEKETPFFVFNLDKIRSKCTRLLETLKPDAIVYAVKCNALPGVLRAIGEQCGFEMNNVGELHKLQKSGVTPRVWINSSPITSARDVPRLVEAGVQAFAVDSFSQIENLKHNAPGAKVYFRISTDNTGSRFELSKRLGIHPDTAPDLIRAASAAGLIPWGLTFHVGSQCADPTNWDKGLKECGKLFKAFPSLEMVNIGGGFPVYYNRAIPTLEEISGVVHQSFSRYFDKKPLFYVEPGRFLVGDTAFAAASVIHVENSAKRLRAIIDLSLFSGLIEILEEGEGFEYPIETDATGPEHIYQICGPTCAGTDIIVREILLPGLHVDYASPEKCSRLYLLNTGAYTLEYIGLCQQAGFNGSPIPKVYYIDGGRLVEGEE